MTKRDIIWIVATMLFTFGTVTSGIILWQQHREREQARQQRRERIALKLRHPARNWAIVPTPPYDWETTDD